jgi:hypothetical protein
VPNWRACGCHHHAGADGESEARPRDEEKDWDIGCLHVAASVIAWADGDREEQAPDLFRTRPRSDKDAWHCQIDRHAAADIPACAAGYLDEDLDEEPEI